MLELLTVENGIALVTLTALEIVLGIDNIVMISVATGRLEEAERKKATRIGLALAMLMRIGLLFAISWIIGLDEPLFEVMDHGVSWKDIILIGGGLFLIAKATGEIHEKMEPMREHAVQRRVSSFWTAIAMILAMDAVFSLDSVITAVGMVDEIAIMIVAVVIAVAVMMIFANPIASFVEKRPTVKILALAFLVLIGVLLVADGLGQHLNRGYVYFAMGFSLVVEFINLRVRAVEARKQKRAKAS